MSALRPGPRRLAALIGKEFRQIVRDPSSILIAGVLPLVLLFLFGYGLSLDATRTRIGLVLEAATPLTRDLASSFVASPYFDVQLGTDRREFEEQLIVGAVRGIVVIPATFDLDSRRPGDVPQVQVLLDGSEPNTAALVQGYAQGVVENWARLREAEVGPAPTGSVVEERFWFNPARTSRYSLVPGCIAIVMALVGTLLTALLVSREWERGTMEALMSTPVTAVELIAGKVVPYFLLGLGSMSVCAIIAVELFGVPFRGSVLALYAISAAFLLPALGQGLLISSATKNQFLSSQVAMITAFLPTFLLSGFLFEIPSMPRAIQWFTYVIPARYLIPSLQTVFMAGDLWPLFRRDIAAMVGFGLLFLTLAVRAMPKRIG
jgi:ABC-2 type transport system permease protein